MAYQYTKFEDEIAKLREQIRNYNNFLEDKGLLDSYQAYIGLKDLEEDENNWQNITTSELLENDFHQTFKEEFGEGSYDYF